MGRPRGGKTGRGRGRPRGGRGGRGRGRKLYPSVFGYIYEPGVEIDSDDGDDFVVYGQFGDPASEGPSNMNMPQPRKSQRKGEGSGASPRKHMDPKGRGSDTRNFGKGRNRQASPSKYMQPIAFRRAAILLNPISVASSTASTTEAGEATNEAESSTTAVTTTLEKMTISNSKETKPENGFVSIATEIRDVASPVKHETDDREAFTFYFDPAPSKVEGSKDRFTTYSIGAASDSSSERASTEETQQESPKMHNKRSRKKKIIRGDDIYVGSSDEDDQVIAEEPLVDDDIAAMLDYIENVQQNDGPGLQESEWLAGDFDPAEPRHMPDDSDDEGEPDFAALDEHDSGSDNIDNGGFDHVSSDESLREHSDDEDNQLTEEGLVMHLKSALKDVPPSLRTGVMRRIDSSKKGKKQKESKNAWRDRMDAKQILKEVERQKKHMSKKQQRNIDTFTVDMHKIDRRIQSFIQDQELKSYQFAPMARYCRRQVHLLATKYNLISYSSGTGAQRLVILEKTENTFLPDRADVELFLQESQALIEDKASSILKYRIRPPKNERKGKQREGKGKGKLQKRSDEWGGHRRTTRAIPGTVVGSHAGPIEETNVGHRMLAAMGWRQGQALGAKNDGIKVPIEAVVRKERRGLGSS